MIKKVFILFLLTLYLKLYLLLEIKEDYIEFFNNNHLVSFVL